MNCPQLSNWSEADAARFMREAADYQRRLGQQQAKQPAPPRQPGAASSQLPSQGVRQVGEGTPSSSTVDGNRYVVPPEFREAHRVFTGGENKTPAPR